MPLMNREPVSAGAVVLERVARGRLDPRVAGQAEVVVGAEHDRLAPLHLHHRARLGLDQAEVGEEVGLLGGLELLLAVVGARPLEDVHGRACRLGHGRESSTRSRSDLASRDSIASAPWHGDRPAGERASETSNAFIKLPFRLHRGHAVGAAADHGAPRVPRPRQESVLRARRGRVLPRRARRRGGGPDHRPCRRALDPVPGRQRRDVRVLRVPRTTRRSRRRWWTPRPAGSGSGAASGCSARWTSPPTTSAGSWSTATSARRWCWSRGTRPITGSCSRASG